MAPEDRVEHHDGSRLIVRGLDGPIATEGFPFIGFASLAALVFAGLGWAGAALIALAATAFSVYFFRNPERYIPDDPAAVISPADGKVISVDPRPQGGELLREEDAVRVSIFMSVFNVHVNRAPVDGRVLETRYTKGAFRVASDRSAPEANERFSMVLETAGGHRLEVVQVAGFVARRIVSFARPGNRCVRGERFGLIRFGSRVDVYLPGDARIRVRVGDRTRSGETILGEMP